MYLLRGKLGNIVGISRYYLNVDKLTEIGTSGAVAPKFKSVFNKNNFGIGFNNNIIAFGIRLVRKLTLIIRKTRKLPFIFQYKIG